MANYDSCRTFSPAAVQLRKLVAQRAKLIKIAREAAQIKNFSEREGSAPSHSAAGVRHLHPASRLAVFFMISFLFFLF